MLVAEEISYDLKFAIALVTSFPTPAASLAEPSHGRSLREFRGPTRTGDFNANNITSYLGVLIERWRSLTWACRGYRLAACKPSPIQVVVPGVQLETGPGALRRNKHCRERWRNSSPCNARWWRAGLIGCLKLMDRHSSFPGEHGAIRRKAS